MKSWNLNHALKTFSVNRLIESHTFQVGNVGRHKIHLRVGYTWSSVDAGNHDSPLCNPTERLTFESAKFRKDLGPHQS